LRAFGRGLAVACRGRPNWGLHTSGVVLHYLQVRILGIDPGLAQTGYGVVDHSSQQSRLVACGCITTRADEEMAQRLRQIHDKLAEVIRTWNPEVAAIENLYFCTNVRTAISVAQGRGVCILATATAQIPLAEYTPLQIKLAVAGYGKATKQQVEKMVRALLCLPAIPGTSHEADALAVALCHAHSHKFKSLVGAALERGRKR
jgi:crossover junction endodeoxyribonuclease RuvC